MNVFVQDDDTKAREFLKRYPVTFPSGYAWDLSTGRSLGFRGMPYTVVVSRDGHVARRFFGPVMGNDLRREIDSLLTAQ